MKISATTVMMPQYDMLEAARLLAELGFAAAEWRCRHIPADQQGHEYSPWGMVKNDFSPANLATRGAELVEVSRETGLAIAGLATAMSATELDEVRLVAKGCAQWGIPWFRIGAPRAYDPAENYHQLLDDTVRAFDEALQITRSYGIKVLLEIHRHTVACSASQAYLVVRHFDPADLGVIFDIANMSLGQGHEPTAMGLDLLGDYVSHVHAGGGQPVAGERGAQGQLLWDWEVTDLANSVIDVPLFCQQLKDRDYQGYLSVEDFRPLDVVEKLRTQINFLRSL